MTENPPVLDRRKIRLGLAVLTLVFAGALVMLFVTDDRLGQAISFGVAALLFVRVVLLVRSLRRSPA